MRTETLSDEQAVRGAHPRAYAFQWKGFWRIYIGVKEDAVIGGPCKTEAEAWSSARQHPTVVAWEAKQGQSAKVRPHTNGPELGAHEYVEWRRSQTNPDPNRAFLAGFALGRASLAAELRQARELVQSLEAKS